METSPQPVAKVEERPQYQPIPAQEIRTGLMASKLVPAYREWLAQGRPARA